MPVVTDYPTLVQEAAYRVSRDDLDWSSFVQAAHLRILRELPDVTHIAATTVTTTNGRASVPANFVTFVGASTDAGGPLMLTTVELVTQRAAIMRDGIPRWIAVDADEFVFAPVPGNGTVVSLRFQTRPPLPTELAPTSYVLTHHPLLYVYGTIAAAGLKLQDEALTSQYEALFAREIEEVRKYEQRRRLSGLSLSVQNTVGLAPP